MFRTRTAARMVALTIGMLMLGTATAGTAVAEDESLPECPLLLEGQTSSCVEDLQIFLNMANRGYNLATSGFFGPATRIAVLDFQGRNGLPADGNVGSETADALLARVDEVRAEWAESCRSDPNALAVPSPRAGGGCWGPVKKRPVPYPTESGEAIGLGKPVGDCLAEEIAGQPIDQGVVEAAKRFATKEGIRRVKKSGPYVSAGKVILCITFGEPAEAN